MYVSYVGIAFNSVVVKVESSWWGPLDKILKIDQIRLPRLRYKATKAGAKSDIGLIHNSSWPHGGRRTSISKAIWNEPLRYPNLHTSSQSRGSEVRARISIPGSTTVPSALCDTLKRGLEYISRVHYKETDYYTPYPGKVWAESVCVHRLQQL